MVYIISGQPNLTVHNNGKERIFFVAFQQKNFVIIFYIEKFLLIYLFSLICWLRPTASHAVSTRFSVDEHARTVHPKYKCICKNKRKETNIYIYIYQRLPWFWPPCWLRNCNVCCVNASFSWRARDDNSSDMICKVGDDLEEEEKTWWFLSAKWRRWNCDFFQSWQSILNWWTRFGKKKWKEVMSHHHHETTKRVKKKKNKLQPIAKNSKKKTNNELLPKQQIHIKNERDEKFKHPKLCLSNLGISCKASRQTSILNQQLHMKRHLLAETRFLLRRQLDIRQGWKRRWRNSAGKRGR